jgi:Cdc6-like AAA superfamily ATPase
MLQYLQIKSHKNSQNKFIVFRERKKKFDKKVKETYVPKKDSLIIYGMNASGKTKEIKKVWAARKSVWNKDNFVWLAAGDSLTEWLHVNLRDTDSKKYIEENHTDFRDHGLNVEKEVNKQYVKLQILANKAKGSIIFIDDIDHLTGKKLEIAKDMMRTCKQFIITADNEHNIDKTIKNIMNQKKAKQLDLTTEASYDVTNALIATFIVTLFVTGQYELAMLVMAARYMTKGKGK